jgi:sugar-specific transcriptional regulator TrmB
MSIKTQLENSEESSQGLISRITDKIFKKARFMKVQEEEKITKATIAIFRNTSSELLISTELDPSFYCQDDVKETIEAASDRGVKIHVLLDSGVDVPERASEIEWIFRSDGVDIRKSNEPVPEWVISDKTNLRLDNQVSEDDPDSTLFVENADTTISDIFIERFNRWWYDNSEEIDDSVAQPVR